MTQHDFSAFEQIIPGGAKKKWLDGMIFQDPTWQNFHTIEVTYGCGSKWKT
jgi:hypothetical protein